MPTPEGETIEEHQQTPETAQTWSEAALAKLKMLESQSGSVARREAIHWEKLSDLLESLYTNQAEGRLIENLEEAAAMIYANRAVDVGPQLRGYFFEQISRFTQLNHELVVSHTLPEMREEFDERDSLAERLGNLSQRTVFELRTDRPAGEKLAWDKGALIARAISRRLLTDLRAQNLQDEVFIFVPAMDTKYQRHNEHYDRGDVVIRFDPDQRKWIATGKSEDKVAAHQQWADRANEINQELNQSLTVPDAVIYDGDKAVGVIETKCWQAEELEAMVEHLAHQRRGTATPGGFVTAAEIDFQRMAAGKLPANPEGQGPEGMNLILKLGQEVAFVEESTGEKIDKPLVVLRLPGNIPPDEIEDLQDLLLAHGFENVLIQQILLDADEVELIANEFIRGQAFSDLLADKFDRMKRGETGKKLKRSDYQKNIKARALALGVSELSSLKEYVPGSSPDAQDKAMMRLKADWEKHFD